MVGAQARLAQARYTISRGVSQRRACALMEVSRSGLYYTLRMPMKDVPVIQAMQRLSGQYPRFGSRRIRVFLAREGIQVGQQRCSRLWSQAGLQVPARRKRRKVGAASQPRPCLPTGRNTVWSYDFVYDACANGPEFASLQLLQWAVDKKLETVLIEPGKPWQNGTNGSFNGKFRDECLSMEWFRNRREARVIIGEVPPLQQGQAAFQPGLPDSAPIRGESGQ